MRRTLLIISLCALSMFSASILQAAPSDEAFAFTVIGASVVDEDAALQDAFRHALTVNAAFSVMQGVRPRHEDCKNEVYQRRSELMAESDMPVVLSLQATDWAPCRNAAKQSMAQDRLRFVRELLFDDQRHPHTKGLSMTQQSASAMFRPYAENMRWEINGVLFATINLPSDNNHYLSAAGRNNEFEDRLVANRHWLRRVFNHAKYHHLNAIVLFTDANPMATPSRSGKRSRRDGFAETRKYLSALVAKYPGRVLIIHSQNATRKLVWRRNLGVIGLGRKKTLDVTVMPGKTAHFSLKRLTAVSAGP